MAPPTECPPPKNKERMDGQKKGGWGWGGGDGAKNRERKRGQTGRKLKILPLAAGVRQQ